MAWSKKCLVGLQMPHNVVNPRAFRVRGANAILVELFDIKLMKFDERKDSDK